jgi:hypothetical protein
MAAGLLDAGRNFFSFVERGFDFFGFDTAAENLRRYRSGQGGLVEYSGKEIERHPALLDAEDESRTEFERRSFTGRTRNRTLNQKLLNLPDGEVYNFFDFWDSRVPLSRPSTYLAFGRTSIQSNGAFSAQRNGDILTIRGTVAHGFHPNERFDFNPGQPGRDAAEILEPAGEAAPFHMSYDRAQDVEAELRYEPGGALTLLRSSWGGIR